MTFDQLVTSASASGASDIHLRAGHAPLVRINGALQRWSSVAALTPAHLEALASRLLSPMHQERLRTKFEVDASWEAPGVGRCRASVFRQRGTIAVSMRLIPDTIPSLDTLGLPPAVVKLAEEQRGLVLITGVTGSGKSTTLAALINLINRNRPEHVLTIEDPIEFVHKDIRATVTQREIGLDTQNYAGALRAALRQDPDVILIGEMRDPETMETALVAAETGHLVFSTLHTLDAPETIMRIVTAFPPHQHPQIRTQLSRVLRAAVSQRLLPRADGQGRALAAEVLISTPYIKDCIADQSKTSLIADAIVAGGSEYGMQSFDQSILGLCQQGAVTVEEAERWVTNVDEFRMHLRGITTGSVAAVTAGLFAGAGSSKPRPATV